MIAKLKYRWRRWREWCHYSRWHWWSKIFVFLGLKKSIWFDSFMIGDMEYNDISRKRKDSDLSI